MKKRSFASFVSCALIVLLLASLSAVAKEPVKIVMMYERATNNMTWQDEMAEKFNATHSDVQVELINVTGYVSGIYTMLAGGAQLDIAFQDPWQVVHWGRDGVAMDLTSFIAQEGQYKDWFPIAFDMYKVGKGVYGLPQDLQVSTVYYNKDAYSTNGLAYPTQKWTYEELLNNARRLSKTDASGTYTHYGAKMPGARNWAPIIWAHGGDLFDNWAAPTRFTGNNPQTRDGLQYLNSLVTTNAVPNRARNGSFALSAGFQNQSLAMIFTNTISMSRFADLKDFEWDVVPYPHGPAGNPGFVSAIGWVVFNQTQHKEEALEVLRFFTSPEAWQRRIEITGLIPPSSRMLQTSWLPSKEMPASRASLFSAIDNARSMWPLHGDIWTPVANELLEGIWGDKPIGSTLEVASDLAAVAIKDLYRD